MKFSEILLGLKQGKRYILISGDTKSNPVYLDRNEVIRIEPHGTELILKYVIFTEGWKEYEKPIEYYIGDIVHDKFERIVVIVGKRVVHSGEKDMLEYDVVNVGSGSRVWKELVYVTYAEHLGEVVNE